MFERIQEWFDRLSLVLVTMSSAAVLVLVGIGDYLTGVDIIFTMFYLIPVSTVTWRAGRTAGIIASTICAISWSVVDYFGRPMFQPAAASWNIAIQFTTFVAYSVVLSKVKTGIVQQRLINEKLQSALSEVKKLSGVLPICAWCKKIRDSEGIWRQLEAFLATHSEVDFTHSICPECKKSFFPDTKSQPLRT